MFADDRICQPLNNHRAI